MVLVGGSVPLFLSFFLWYSPRLDLLGLVSVSVEDNEFVGFFKDERCFWKVVQSQTVACLPLSAFVRVSSLQADASCFKALAVLLLCIFPDSSADCSCAELFFWLVFFFHFIHLGSSGSVLVVYSKNKFCLNSSGAELSSVQWVFIDDVCSFPGILGTVNAVAPEGSLM